MIEFKPLASSSAANTYVVSDGKTTLLLDAGLKMADIRRGLNFNLSSVDAALISHQHGDHSRSVRDLIKAGIDVYLPEDAISELGVQGHRVHQLDSLRTRAIGSWTVLPFPVEHDVQALGFLLANEAGEKLLYVTDSYYVRYRFDGLTVIAVECNYALDILDRNIAEGRVSASLRGRLLRSHFSLEHVKDFLRANDLSKVREVHLLHLSDANSDEERFKREVQEICGCPVYVAGR